MYQPNQDYHIPVQTHSHKLKDDPQMDVQDIRNEMKELSMRYIMKETGKKPVFIGVVVEI